MTTVTAPCPGTTATAREAVDRACQPPTTGQHGTATPATGQQGTAAAATCPTDPATDTGPSRAPRARHPSAPAQ
jgi:hypothetical protein